MIFWKKIGAAISGQRFPITLCILIFCLVAMLELRFPYFFLQDENRVQHLPLYVHNIHALLNGDFPLYNFHQFLGIRVGIQNAALYPFNYIGLAFSQLFLGHYLGAVEFISFIHLVIAGLGFFYMLRSFDLEECSCLFGAFAYAACGYVITLGNSWIPILECASYLPWIIMYGIRLAYVGGYATCMVLVGIRTLLLLVGYPQLYVYIVTFEIITVLSLMFADSLSQLVRNVRGSRTVWPIEGNFRLYILSHAGALGISMPLILLAYHQASQSLTRKSVLDWDTYITNSYDLKLWLNGLVTPFNEAGISTWNELHFISHVGYLTLLGIILALCTLHKSVARNRIIVFAGCAVIALMWSGDTVVTRLVYYLPVYSKLRWPFKLQLFTSFYMIAVSAFGFDLICRKTESIKSGARFPAQFVVSLLLTLHLLNFVGIYALFRQYSFTQFLDMVPFDEPLKGVLSKGRIVSILQKDISENQLGKAVGFTAPLIGYNYATLWGLYHLGGHDSLVPEENFRAAFDLDYDSAFKVRPGSTLDDELKNSLEYFRLWGVRWYIVDKAFPVSEVRGLRLFSKEETRNIYYDQEALPFAFWADSPLASAVNCKFRTNSIVLNTRRPSEGMAVVNVLWNPFFSALVDGKKVELKKTNGKQLLVVVPGGNHLVEIRYSDPYLMVGLFISMLTMIALSGYGYMQRRAI
jgi:hypothetical protein